MSMLTVDGWKKVKCLTQKRHDTTKASEIQPIPGSWALIELINRQDRPPPEGKRLEHQIDQQIKIVIGRSLFKPGVKKPQQTTDNSIIHQTFLATATATLIFCQRIQSNSSHLYCHQRTLLPQMLSSSSRRSQHITNYRILQPHHLQSSPLHMDYARAFFSAVANATAASLYAINFMRQQK